MTAPKVVAQNERTNQWIRRLAVIGLALILVLNTIAAAGVLWSVLEVRWGAKADQHHLDCVVGVLFRQDPPGCPGVKDQLVSEGVLPPGWPGTTTTTTTTARSAP